MTNENNVIETLKLLGRLAELVEIWQEPPLKNLDFINLMGWYPHLNTARKPERVYVLKTDPSIEINPTEFWNHPVTQNAFKAEVRNVCLELYKLSKIKTKWDTPQNKEYLAKIKAHLSIETILCEIVHAEANGCLLEAVCNYLGTSLIEEKE